MWLSLRSSFSPFDWMSNEDDAQSLLSHLLQRFVNPEEVRLQPFPLDISLPAVKCLLQHFFPLVIASLLNGPILQIGHHCG